MDILDLTTQSPDIVVRDGELIIREGERSPALFVLVRGALEVRRRGLAVVRMREPGTIVGELGMLLDIVASADVVAVGDCTVRRMDDAEATFADNPEFARHLATLLARRLLQISTYLTDIQEQYADRQDTLGLVPEVVRELLGGQASIVETGSEREPESPY
jgi:CRP-like cAMP-binding protein